MLQVGATEEVEDTFSYRFIYCVFHTSFRISFWEIFYTVLLGFNVLL
jgi:hypothetical protein